MKILTAILLFNSLSFANTTEDVTKKAQIIFTTIAQNASTSDYLQQTQNISDNSQLEVDTKTFLALIAKGSNELNSLLKNPDVRSKLGNFIKSNRLNPYMVGYQHLQIAQKNYVSILILLEFQKQLFERSDLDIFGRQTVRNLNLAINEVIQLQHLSAERSFQRVLMGKTTEQMKDNFLKVGLAYKKTLTPSEQWVNEALGLDRNYIPPVTPHTVLNKMANESLRKLNLKLRSLTSMCLPIFFT